MMPNLFTLYSKILFFSISSIVLGWSIYPKVKFKSTELGRYVYWMGLGISFLLLTGFTETAWNIPGKFVYVLPALVILTRLGYQKFRTVLPRQNLASGVPSPKVLLLGLFTSFIIVSVYLIPFIGKGTSGIYAYGGGDQSSYFRISEIFLDKTQNDIEAQWNDHREEFYIPNANWSANQLAHFIQNGLSWTYANQTIVIPFLALGGDNREESYTAAVALYILFLCWSASLLMMMLLRGQGSVLAHSVGALFVIFGSGALSLVLKHTIPATVAWAMLLLFVALVLEAIVLAAPIAHLPMAILLSVIILFYLPGFVVLGPVVFYLIILLILKDRTRAAKDIFAVLGLSLILINIEIARPIKLFFANSHLVLDYNIKWGMLWSTISGIADFETVLSHRDSLPSWTFFGLIPVAIGLVYFFRQKENFKIVSALVFFPILAGIFYYMLRTGHYQVIRMTEFLSVLISAAVGVGFALMNERNKGLLSKAFWVFPVLYVGASYPIRKEVFHTITRPHSESRASLKDSRAILLSRKLEQRLSGERPMPIVYWMNWGAIQMANNDILFRRLPFVEGFETDYTYLWFDLLAEKNIANSVFVSPEPIAPDILKFDSEFNRQQFIETPGYQVLRPGLGNGATLLGTGWRSASLYGDSYIRFLRSNIDAGIVLWVDEDSQLKVTLDLVADGEKDSILAVRLGDGVPLSPEKDKQKKYYRREREDFETYLGRVLTGRPTSNEMAPNPDELTQRLRKWKDLSVAETNIKFYEIPDFQRFIRTDFENGKETEPQLRDEFSRGEIRFEVPGRYSKSQHTFSFLLNARKGIHILHLFPRSQEGGRAGKDPRVGITFDMTGKLSDFLVYGIKVENIKNKEKQVDEIQKITR